MYSVTWQLPILDRPADLYVAADPAHRDRIAAGVEAFNRRLAVDPLGAGESRDGDWRIGFPDLLVVRFRVDLMADTVRVAGVNRYGR